MSTTRRYGGTGLGLNLVKQVGRGSRWLDSGWLGAGLVAAYAPEPQGSRWAGPPLGPAGRPASTCQWSAQADPPPPCPPRSWWRRTAAPSRLPRAAARAPSSPSHCGWAGGRVGGAGRSGWWGLAAGGARRLARQAGAAALPLRSPPPPTQTRRAVCLEPQASTCNAPGPQAFKEDGAPSPGPVTEDQRRSLALAAREAADAAGEELDLVGAGRRCCSMLLCAVRVFFVFRCSLGAPFGAGGRRPAPGAARWRLGPQEGGWRLEAAAIAPPSRCPAFLPTSPLAVSLPSLILLLPHHPSPPGGDAGAGGGAAAGGRPHAAPGQRARHDAAAEPRRPGARLGAVGCWRELGRRQRLPACLPARAPPLPPAASCCSALRGCMRLRPQLWGAI